MPAIVSSASGRSAEKRHTARDCPGELAPRAGNTHHERFHFLPSLLERRLIEGTVDKVEIEIVHAQLRQRGADGGLDCTSVDALAVHLQRGDKVI